MPANQHLSPCFIVARELKPSQDLTALMRQLWRKAERAANDLTPGAYTPPALITVQQADAKLNR